MESVFDDRRPTVVFGDAETIFTLVEVNDVIDDRLVDYQIPEGAGVTDLRTGEGYIMGANGQPATVPEPLRVGSGARSATAATWLLRTTIVVLTILVILFAFRTITRRGVN